jgi:hypothetical protein
MSENNIGVKTIDELIAEIRADLVGLRSVPFASVNATGVAIEWKLRDLEQAVRTLEAKYDYAREAATALYKRGGLMRERQRRYFRDRTQVALLESKGAEREFDAVLGEVARHGKPQQATLPLGETFTGGKA